MKKLLYVLAVISAVMLSSCDNAAKNQGPEGGTTKNDPTVIPGEEGDIDGQTPDTDKTKLWPVQTDSTTLWGFIDQTGKMVIPAVYEQVYAFSCGWALVVSEDKECLFIDEKGKIGKSLDAEQLDDVCFYYNKLRVRSGEFYAMWDNKFKEVIPASYVRLGSATKDGLIAFCNDKNSKTAWGYLNNKGEIVISPQFTQAGDFKDGIAVVSVPNDSQFSFGLINTQGEYLIEPQKYILVNLGSGLVSRMTGDGESDVLDKTGTILSKVKYNGFGDFSEGLARFVRNGKYGYINASCEEVMPPIYTNTRDCYDGVMWVRESLDTPWKLISKKGETILNLQEEESPYTDFHNGLALVISNNESTYTITYRWINKNGETKYTWIKEMNS